MAVYTEVSDDELAVFVASYELGALLSYKGIAEGVENTNYLLHTEKGPIFLTLYEKRVDPNDLPFFLGLMEHLAKAGLNCPTPVRDGQGRMLRTLAGRPAALVTFLEGVWIRRPQPRHCAAVGKALAGLHVAGRGFGLTRANGLGLSAWRDNIAGLYYGRAEGDRPEGDRTEGDRTEGPVTRVLALAVEKSRACSASMSFASSARAASACCFCSAICCAAAISSRIC